jgi:hypothetical protein
VSGDIAVMMTAWRRPQYLARTLQSWAKVDGIRDVAAFQICLDPSDRLDKMLAVIAEARGDYGLPITAHCNARHLGVSSNPADSGTAIFREHPDVDFIVMAEEDLKVSDDLLRYMAWADGTFRSDPRILCACAHSPDNPHPDADPAAVVLEPRFRVWVWGTWRDRWFDTLLPDWDRDYSSGTPEDPRCGFDCNIDGRIIPRGGFRCVLPLASRSQNIGQFGGVHADAGVFASTFNPSFRETFGVVDYKVAELRSANDRTTDLLLDPLRPA